MAGKQGVPDERHRVDQRVRDDHRGGPFPPQEQDREDHAHHRVPGEAPEPLVQVVRAAQEGADRHGAGGADAKEPQPRQQVAGDQDLFEQPVLQRGQQQDRDAPPDVRQAFRDDVEGGAGLVGEEIKAEPAEPDHRGEHRAARQVAPGLGAVHADRAEAALARPGEQVPGEQHRRGVARQGDELQEQVEQRPPGRLRAVQHGALRAQRLVRGQRADERDERVDPAGAQRHREDRDDLPAQEGPLPVVQGGRGRPGITRGARRNPRPGHRR